jgi:hypothetical protein
MESKLSILPQIYDKPVMILWIVCLISVCFWGCSGSDVSGKGIPPNCPLSFQIEDSMATKALSQYFHGLESDLEFYVGLLEDIGSPAFPEDGQWRITDLGNAGFALAVVLPAKGIPAIRDWGMAIEAVSQYKGVDIYQLSNENERQLAAAKYRGMLLLGRYALQVEQSVSALSKREEQSAMHAQNSAIFIHLDNLLHANGMPVPANHEMVLEYLTDLGSGIELSIKGEADSLLFSGQLRGMARKLPALDSLSFGAYIPSNVSWVSCLPHQPGHHSSGSSLFSQYLEPLLTGHLVTMEIEERPGKFYLLPIAGEALGEKVLDTLARQTGELDQLEYHFFEVRQLLSEGLLAPIGIDLANPFFTLVGNCFLVGEDRLGLEQILARIVVGEVLGQDVDFLSSWNALSLNPSGWYYEPEGRVATRAEGPGRAPDHHRQSLWGINEKGEISGISVKKVEQAEEAELLWVANLRANARSSVQLVSENGQYSYVVQDEQNWLYHFGHRGQLIWERPLAQAIIGDISVLDYFGSGSPSIAFVTSTMLYLIDEHAKDIGSFPVQLPARIAAPLLVTDLEGNGRYAFFIGCINGDIYGFNADGSPLPAWGPNSATNTAIQQIMHIQHTNKDFFLALNEAGVLHAFGRDGSLRFDSIDTKSCCAGYFFYQDVKPLGRIALGGSGGMAHVVNLNGEYFRLKLWKDQQLNGRFLFVNVWGDQRKDYWAYHDNRLCIHGYQDNQYLTLTDTSTAFTMDTSFCVSHEPYDWVGVLSEKEKRISVLLPDASVHPAFPLAGTTAFCMHPDGKGEQKIIVGNGAQLYAYQIKDIQ